MSITLYRKTGGCDRGCLIAGNAHRNDGPGTTARRAGCRFARWPARSLVHWTLLALTVAAVLAPRSSAAHRTEWRHWSKDDGLAANYIDQVHLGKDGRVWMAHGRGGGISVLDGYTARALTPPAEALETIEPGIGEELWVRAEGGVLRWWHGEWKLHRITSIGGVTRDIKRGVRVLAVKPGRLLVLTQAHLLYLNAATGSVRVVLASDRTGFGPFGSITSGAPGEVWLGGLHGVARVTWPGILTDPEAWERHLFPDGALEETAQLTWSAPDELIAVVRTRDERERLGLRFQHGEWEVLHRSTHSPLRMWRGSEGLLWIRQNTEIYHGVAGKLSFVDTAEIVGAPQHVVSAPDGKLWVGTENGLFLLLPMPWETPAELMTVRSVVHAACEDRQGRLWFAAGDRLLLNDHGRWVHYELPPGETTYTLHTNAITQLPDGKIAVKTQDAGHLLLFDPATERFLELRHPLKRMFRLISARRNGTVFVNTSAGQNRFDQAIEIWDGQRFEKVIDLGESWGIGRMRFLHEDDDGVLWIGGTEGFARYQDGRYELITEGGVALAGVYAITRSSRGTWVVAGRDGSVLEFDGSRWSPLFGGLGTIRSIAETSDGSLWFAASSGVCRYKDGQAVTMSTPEGLPSSVAYELFLDSSQNLWAGTAKGLGRWQPGHDLDPPAARIDTARAGMRFPAGSPIALPLTATDRWKTTVTGRLVFSSSLNGAGWTDYSEHPWIEFSSLGAGTHSLRLRAMDRVGNVGNGDVDQELIVIPPWYLEPAFLIGGSLAGIVMVLLVAAAIQQYRQRGRLVVQLERAAREASESSQAKGRFLANMSHEIRTPMNGVIGLIDLTLDSRLKSDQRQMLESASESARFLLRILNGVLDYSKIEAGKLRLEMEPFSLRERVGQTVHVLASRARQQGLSLTYVVDRKAPDLLVGDSGKLRQILFNLLGNAIKFTEAGHVHLEVASHPPASGRVSFEFVVADTGIGIPPDKQNQIFEAFEQADASVTRKYGGTGLGLAISKRLAAQMGGSMTVSGPQKTIDSSLGGPGVEFRFSLSFAVQDQPVDPRRTRLSGTRLLILHANPRHAQSIAELAAYLGASTTMASGASAAARILAASSCADRYHLLIADERLLPDCRREADSARVPAIVVCGEISPAHDCKSLLSPVELAAFLRVLENSASECDPAEEFDASAPDKAKLEPLRILAAEDNQVNQVVLRRLLEREGHQVTIVGNGREALAALENDTFDVVLMDMQMPVLGGREALRAIREREAAMGGHLPVVAVTAHAVDGDRESCITAGADSYISKPIVRAELFAVLARVCGKALEYNGP